MLLRIALFFATITGLLATVPAYAEAAAKQQVSTRQLMAISRAITGVQRVSIPLLIAIDRDGRVITHQKDWDAPAVMHLFDLASTAEGDGRFVDVLDGAGVALHDAGNRRPMIVALSVPTACEPCASMESILEAAADRADQVIVTILFSSPTMAPPNR